MFVKENHRPVAETPETVRLFGGHFVPDGSTMQIMVEGAGETLNELHYGDMSSGLHLEPARYEVVMTMEGGAPGKSGDVAAERDVPLPTGDSGVSGDAVDDVTKMTVAVWKSNR